jgi:branched-chain amino acid transport system substrate-binding protein
VHMTTRQGRTLTVLATAVLSGAGLAACGSSTPPASAGSSAVSSAPASAGEITVGFANNEGSAISIPAYRYGAEAAVKYINAHGGVNGKKIDLDECIDDGSPSGSVNCANKFVDDHAVVYDTGIDVGADAALPVLSSAGIPYVTEFPWGTVQRSSPDAFALGGGDTAFYAAPLQALKDVHATTVGDFYYDGLPTTKGLLQFSTAIAKKLGIRLVPIPIAATNADWTAAIATAMADHVNSMWGILQENDCIGMVGAARGAGFGGPISVGSCTAYIAALGKKAGNTLGLWPYYFPQLAASAPPAVQAQIKVYTAAMDANGQSANLNGFATASFATMMELAEVMKEIKGPVNAASLKAALAKADVPGFLGPRVNCAQRPFGALEPAACNAQMLMFKVTVGASGPERQLVGTGWLNTAGLLG